MVFAFHFCCQALRKYEMILLLVITFFFFVFSSCIKVWLTNKNCIYLGCTMWFFFLRYTMWWFNVYYCSVTKLFPTLCNTMDCNTLGFPVLYYLLEFAHAHVLWFSDTIEPSYSLLPPSPALGLSQHQRLFQWVDSLHQVAKVLEFQLQLSYSNE